MLLPAAVLAAGGVSVILVGSGALWLHGEAIAVHDADVVVEPGEQNLRLLHDALRRLAVRPRDVPTAWRLAELDIVNIRTSYGMLDCMLERGREDWQLLAGNASRKYVTDVSVLVAAAADAWALRRRFKG